MIREEDVGYPDEDPWFPPIPNGTSSYLEDYCGFSLDNLLTTTTYKNNDEGMGYIKGVRDVLRKLKSLERRE